MNINVQTDFIEEAAPSMQLHLLPCRIEHDGPAKVSTYFLVEESENRENATETALEVGFRGRQLKGREISLPDNYIGLCFAETSQKTRVEEYEDEHEPCRYWKTRGKFNKYTVWEHDFEPSKRENPFMRVQDWIQLASIMHSDV